MSLGQEFTKVRKGGGVHVVGKLAVIALPELGELARFMAVPTTKGRRGSDVLAPFIQLGALLRDAAWPQPIHENSRPQLVVDWVVYAPDTNLMNGHVGILALC
jgi:hypothetical protein